VVLNAIPITATHNEIHLLSTNGTCCTSLCQLAPAAFADYVKQTGWMPWLKEHDPNCAKFKRLAANPDDTKHP